MLKKLFLIGFILSLAGCIDKPTVSLLNGTFTGRFYYVPPINSDKTSAPAKVTFSENTFISQGNTNYVPAGGSGIFEIKQDDILDFKDKNIWTANFDWGLVLNGKYKYQFKGDSLILTRYIEPCKNANCGVVYTLYQYRLKRTN